jgi:hypothetical protein
MSPHDFTISKRLLGFILVIVGIVGFTAILMIDLLDVGREGGVGPSQQIALSLMLAVIALGVTLIPLGSRPA